MGRYSLCLFASVWMVLCATPGLPAQPADPAGQDQDQDEADIQERAAQRARGKFALLDKSHSLLWDWNAIEDFATLPDVDVVSTILEELKKKPPQGQENRPYLLAASIGLRAKHKDRTVRILDSEAATLLELLSAELRDPAHAWLAYNAAVALAHRKAEGAELEKLILDKSRPAALRAAMLLGLAESGDASLFDHVEPLLSAAAKLRKKADRARLQEGVAWAVAKVCRPLLEREEARRKDAKAMEEEDDDSDPVPWGPQAERRRAGRRAPAKKRAPAPPAGPPAEWKAAMRSLSAVASLLEEKSLTITTRRQVMRALQYAWNAKVAYESAESWRQMGLHEERKAEKDSGLTTVRFFGIPSSGSSRILFLLDGSDSMLTPLKPEEKEAFRKLLETDGPPGVKVAPPPDRSRKGPAGRTGVGSGRSRLERMDGKAWDDVKTRFDAARAHLKHTLALMSPDVELAVVLFGSEAETLQTTPSFLKATESNRVRIVKELDSMKPGAKDKTHPHGTLHGETNIYDAFALAFSLRAGRRAPNRSTGRSRTRSTTAVMDPKVVGSCADTIYLLSDGIPTRDGFRGRTPAEEQGGFWVPAIPEMEGETEVIVNPETGATEKRKYRIPARPRHFAPARTVAGMDPTGPYVYSQPLVNDVCRRNLFVRATVHVVAIGEAGTFIGPPLAEAAGGRFLGFSPRGRRGPSQPPRRK